MNTARYIAATALLRVEKDGAYSNITLASLLNEHKLSIADKALASILFYGVLDRKITLDFYINKFSNIKPKKIDEFTRQAIRIGLFQLYYTEKIPVSAAVNESVELVKNSDEKHNSGFVNAILRKASENRPELPNGNDLYSLSVRYSCPVWIISELLRDYTREQTEKILKAYLSSSKLFIRVNTLKTDCDTLIMLLKNDNITAIKTDIENCLYIVGGIDFKNNDYFNKGYFFVQDTAAQNCALAINAKKGERILDVCAAPGGKSFSIAICAQNCGEVVSCDIYENRVSLIKKGAQRLGIDIINATVNDACVFNESLGQFDGVLCDVPCSGFGVIKRKPEIKYKAQDNFKELEEIQLKILETSSCYVKDGGRLLYSTCTLRKDENEKIVNRFLEQNNNYVCEYMHTDLPSEDNDGFFRALLLKRR